jgi:hypothetical protein
MRSQFGKDSVQFERFKVANQNAIKNDSSEV